MAPEAVLAAHVSFIRAGADVIQTNTFGANAVKLGAHRFESRAVELNAAGAKIARDAREVAGRDVLIAGSIGPLGTSLEYVGNDTSSGAALYGEQAAVLAGRGVDMIVLETFTSLDELVVAVGAVRAQCDLPVIAQITVQDDGETVTGARGDQVARALGALGVAAVGINCSLGPQSALAGLREMRDVGDHSADDPTQHRAAHVPRRTRALSRCVGGLCRGVRRPGDGTGRASGRRLLRYPAASHRRHPPRGRRSASRPLHLHPARAAAARPARRTGLREPAGAAAGGGRVGRVGRTRPAQRREPGAAVGNGGRDPRSRRCRVLRHQRQPDGARSDEFADDLDAGTAAPRRRDDPPPHASRHHRPRARVTASGSARQRNPKRAGRDRRLPPTGRSRRLRRLLPGGRGRSGRDHRRTQPRHRPRRQDAGCPDGLLYRGGRQPDRRRHGVPSWSGSPARWPPARALR